MLTAYADADGRLLALDCEATVNSGAYSAYPFSACLEAGQVASILPGLYDFPHYRCRAYSVATNKPPILPYRGVARTGVCFALEVTLDALARKIGIEPSELRFKSLVRPEQMPFDNIAKRHFNSGDYPEALRQAVDAIGFDKVRERQQRGEPDGRRIGIGFAMYSEQAGHGTSVYAAWGIPFVPGHEPALARFTPDGGLELRIGAHSHGQGLETTLSQVAHSILGVPHDRIRLVHGDTAETPYSTGTWGSRCMIMAGGAVAAACDELAARVLRIGAGLLQARPEEVRLVAGEVVGPSGASRSPTWRAPGIAGRRICRPTSIRAASRSPPATRPSATPAPSAMPRMPPSSPSIPETGELEILDYVVVEDGGTLVNPMIVDGQIVGGAAQGIGTALYEEMRFDAQGQPQASTLSDYLLPGPTEMPEIRILHMETPSPYTRFGQKGIGEGGAIAPPAAITNAVNDALAGSRRRAAGLAGHAAAHRRGDRAGARQGGSRMKPVAFDYARPRIGCGGAADAGRQCRGEGAGRRTDAGAHAQPAARAAGAAGRHHAHPRAGRGDRGRRRRHHRRHGHARGHRGRPRRRSRPAAFSRAWRAASPTARCARAAPSAAASPMPIPPPTGSRASPRSAPRW